MRDGNEHWDSVDANMNVNIQFNIMDSSLTDHIWENCSLAVYTYIKKNQVRSHLQAKVFWIHNKTPPSADAVVHMSHQ